MLILYTGNGKGKTTAALGMALRASGYDKKVCLLQFVKEESWPEGARLAIRKNLPNIEIRALGSGWVGIMGDKKPLKVHKQAAKKAVSEATKAIKSKKYDLIILDELLGSLHGKLITRSDVLKILNEKYKTKNVDLVLTGRNAPSWLIKQADLVTEMREIKHPFQKGFQAKRGIDY